MWVNFFFLKAIFLGRRTEEEVLKAEEEVEGYVFGFCLGEEEEGC